MNALTSAHLAGRKQKSDGIQVSSGYLLLELARRASRDGSVDEVGRWTGGAEKADLLRRRSP